MEEDEVSYARTISDFASNMLQNLKAFVSSLVPFITRKRVWDLTDDSDSGEGTNVELEFTSPKRIRLQDITMSDNNLLPATPKVTQNEDSKDVQFVQQLSKGHQFNFSNSKLRVGSKENWRTPEKMREFSASISPKNKFRAPAHCKSPPKLKPMTTESNSDVQFVGVIKKQNPANHPIKKSTSTLQRRQHTLNNFKSPSGKAMTSLSLLGSSQESFNAEVFQRLSREEYSTLLGTFIKNSEGTSKNNSMYTKPAIEVDLTKYDQNDLTECISHIDLNDRHKKERSVITKNRVIDLTKTTKREDTKEKVLPVISLVENEELKAQPVIRKNSLANKIKEVPCASPTWLNDVTTRYRKKLSEMDAERENVHKYWAALIERNEKYLLEWTENRISKQKAFADFVCPIIEEPTFPELTPEMKAKVKAALKPNPAEELIIHGFGISIKRRDISTLKGLNWLNDEVINFYMNLLMDRAKDNPQLPKVYAFNTFFYPKLVKQGHSSLKRWTRKVDIFIHDLIVVPVHLQMHWCMAIINLKEKTIKYYDSMGHPNDVCLKALLTYLIEEFKDKKNGEYDTNGWVLENVKDLPQQNNGSDCGVFACTFAEYICRNASFTFSQKEMSYFREKMVYEILTSSLMVS